MTRTTLLIPALFTILAAAAGPLSAQERASDRWRFLRPETVLTLDPRRQPVPAESVAGPEGSIVITGGRIFDGTGSAPAPGTLVIERNRITVSMMVPMVTWKP